MNEQITLLAAQASDDGDHIHYYNLAFAEKFAELIVAECITTVQKRYMGDNNREDMEVRRCVADMKQHFGVEDQVENSNQEHTCPYKEDINGDYETLCNCDPEQTLQCSHDI